MARVKENKNNFVGLRLTNSEFVKVQKIVREIQEDCPQSEISLSDAIRWCIRSYGLGEEN